MLRNMLPGNWTMWYQSRNIPRVWCLPVAIKNTPKYVGIYFLVIYLSSFSSEMSDVGHREFDSCVPHFPDYEEIKPGIKPDDDAFSNGKQCIG